MLEEISGSGPSELRAGEAQTPPAVLLENLTKRYRQDTTWSTVLLNVSLSVPQGTIQGVIGFSGAGKTTLLRCISRLELPDEGKVLIDGTDLARMNGTQLRSARQRLGVVFQQLHLFRSRTVAQNIALPLELAGARKKDIDERVLELLAWFGLEAKADSYPSQLSGGQQQRVAIARALATKPAVLLSDEPTSALDPETTASVLALLRRVRDELGVTILLITHELIAVRAICDRVAVLDQGVIVEEGSVEQVLLRPAHKTTQRLLGRNLGLEHLAEYLGGMTKNPASIFLEVQFVGESATRQVLSTLVRTFEITVNILRADIGELNRSAYGFLVVELGGTTETLEQSIGFLEAHGAIVTHIDPWSEAETEGSPA
ncbi:methionine ABC transporter ATP-binding protein [Granulicella paludicola]|jgi:D-methionine transport system ATP-binding protein|uniref:methionine ABC transporter ATP-binding protein n=1 Tax=Granulicella paludicola TaxID=474951 RepID=UPI0021DF99CB|nr:ATP-binding cassette domain-containing protein [Granulicella paludicola]